MLGRPGSPAIANGSITLRTSRYWSRFTMLVSSRNLAGGRSWWSHQAQRATAASTGNDSSEFRERTTGFEPATLTLAR